MWLLKEAAIQIGSGGSAGFIEVCIMHPLDLVKTRLQIQSGKQLTKNDSHHYNGVIDVITKMCRTEGYGSLWKGIIPPILVETPKRAVKFFTFAQYQQFFLFGSPTPTPLTFALAGFTAGLTEGFLVSPFEVVKVSLQANKKHTGQVPSTWATTKEIVRKDGIGLSGLNKGLTATLLRASLFNTVYFGFYHSVKGYFPTSKDATFEFLRKISIGFLSGVLASCVNIPFDVAKSRIQGPQPVPGQVKYHSTVKTIMTVYHEEGFRALYKGLLPKILRLGPGGAIMLLIYEYMHEFLTATFK